MDTNQVDYSSFSDASFRNYARAAKSLLTSSRVQNNGEQSHTSEGVQVNPSDVVITISSDGKSDNLEVCENSDGQMDQVCRICLCSPESVSSKTTKKNGLIQLGCKCKGHTGVVHVECGQAWFNKKGNRTCEICGSKVENIFGVPEDISTCVISGARYTENVVIDLSQAIARDREITETNETSDGGDKGREYFCAGIFIAFCACLLVILFFGSLKSR